MSEINIKPFPLIPFLSVCGERWLAPRGGLLVCQGARYTPGKANLLPSIRKGYDRFV